MLAGCEDIHWNIGDGWFDSWICLAYVNIFMEMLSERLLHSDKRKIMPDSSMVLCIVLCQIWHQTVGKILVLKGEVDSMWNVGGMRKQWTLLSLNCSKWYLFKIHIILPTSMLLLQSQAAERRSSCLESCVNSATLENLNALRKLFIMDFLFLSNIEVFLSFADLLLM